MPEDGSMILILGGTIEGRALAAALHAAGRPHLLSLAGRTTAPEVASPVRVGGFGGAQGLAAFLREQRVQVVVDATHPFAATISRNAQAACRLAGVRLIRCARPGWGGHPLAGTWTWVDDHAAAAQAVLGLGARRPLLTVGRQHTLDYSPALDALQVLARVAEPPSGVLPASWRLLIARGPYLLEDEARLLASESIDALVTKDSGGDSTAAKLDAAAAAGVPVVVIRRPGTAPDVETAPDVAACLELLQP